MASPRATLTLDIFKNGWWAVSEVMSFVRVNGVDGWNPMSQKRDMGHPIL